MKRNNCLLLVILWVTLTLIQGVFAQSEDFDYSELDIEELVKVKIVTYSSAARKQQTLTETAAALFVITQNEIRRSGVSSLPEALRLVPGVQVAQIDANQWAISARGLNKQFADKLLVMIDGRTVYTPLRSGVFWEVQDTLLEDVDHIEVVLGPGASLWGANAVNGVINIITKSAQETQESLVSTSLGKGEERYSVGVRQGNALAGGGHYRVYGKLYQHDHSSQDKGKDQWRTQRGGFRMDWKSPGQDNFTFQGDIYEGAVKESDLQSEKQLAGLNLLSRWQRLLDKGDFILQTYYDQTQRDEVLYKALWGTYDIDFQRRWVFPGQQEILGGLAYRYTQDKIDNSPLMSYHPAQESNHLFSAFLQGDFHISLPNLFSLSQVPTPQDAKKLRLTLGCKWEYYEDEKLQIQPNLRLLWNHGNYHTFWGAISRAVRAPSRTDKDIFLDMNSSQGHYVLQGNPHFKPEILVAYEWGYRFNHPDYFLLDSNFFVNKYSNLLTTEPIDSAFSSAQLTLDNQMIGTVYGLEIAAQWEANNYWKFRGAYSYLDIRLQVSQESQDIQATLAQGESPQHQMSLRSFLNLPHNVSFDTLLYYVDDLPTLSIPHYIRFDLRIGWQPKPTFELSFGIRNLFDKQHPEFTHRGLTPSLLVPTEIPRATYLQLRYQF